MRKDRQVRNHRSVTFSHSIRGASSTDVIPPANHLPQFPLKRGWGFFVYQITRFGSPVLEIARAIHALA